MASRLLAGRDDYSWAKTGRPAFDRWCQAWDYAQANDREIYEADPLIGPVQDAIEKMQSQPTWGFANLLALAERGSVWAMLHVAGAYLSGQGAQADSMQAETWYRRAFEAGSLRALLDYGGLLRNRGEFERAEKVYAVGAAQDWGPALCWQAICLVRQSDNRKTYQRAYPLLERAAALECPRARLYQSHWLSRGRLGLRRIPQGMSLMRRLMKQIVNRLDDDGEVNGKLTGVP